MWDTGKKKGTLNVPIFISFHFVRQYVRGFFNIFGFFFGFWIPVHVVLFDVNFSLSLS